MTREEKLLELIFQDTDMTREIEDDELIELIHRALDKEGEEKYIPLHEKAILGKEMFNSLRKLDILQELIEQDDITEIMINGTENIFIEKNGQIYQLGKRFPTKEKLEDVIQQIVAKTNRVVNEASPIVDARLEDGSRVNVVLRPVALNGPIVTIRKFPKEVIGMEDLIRMDAVNREIVDFLKDLVEAKYNIFISGGTGTGKTTFLNALSDFIPKDERIVTIEDNAELQIKGVPNLVRLEVRNANVEGEGEISLRDLIKASLRMRPDRIIVGEVRGEEAVDMLQSLNTGHCGASSGHANTPEDMISRLEMMVLMGMDVPLQAVRRQIASAVDVIVHLGRLRDKSRKLLKIVELIGCDREILMQTIYEFRETGEEAGIIKGQWIKVNEIQKREKLLAKKY